MREECSIALPEEIYNAIHQQEEYVQLCEANRSDISEVNKEIYAAAEETHALFPPRKNII